MTNLHKNPVPESFDSRYPFPATLPYLLWYKERVPLLHAFELGLSNCLFRSNGKNPPRLGGGPMPLPHPAQRFLAAECGVFRGTGLAACAELAKAADLPVTIYGLDTFVGLPSLGKEDLTLAPTDAPYLSSQLFADTSLESVQRFLEESSVSDYTVLVPGLFEETLKSLPNEEYFFVNIDCDLYEPHIQCLEFFYPRVPPGGIIFFDDYHSVSFPMARQAIDDFMQGRPERLFHLRYDYEGPNQTKAFIIKF
jgi:O-methyltransferase